VRQEAIDISLRHEVRLVMVTNGGVRPHPHALVDTKYVSQGPDEADKWIADSVDAGDVVVTNDILLAAEVIKAGAFVLRPDGSELTAQNIGNQLASRDLMADLRATQPLDMAKIAGGRSFSASDRSRFKQALEKLVCLQKQI